MKLQPPLSYLFERCQTICVAECCGIDAYDFSPIHIASYLIMWRGSPDDNEVEALLNQLSDLKERAGTNGLTIDQMNQKFSSVKIGELVEEIAANIQVARRLIEQSEALRVRRNT